MKGRKPTSRDLRILKGTAGKVSKIAKPYPADRWNCPRWVTREGRAFHKKNFPIARSINALTELDKDSWFLLCETYAKIRRCHAEIDADGLTIKDSRGSIKKHPITSILNQLMTHYRGLSDNFGLNPTGRERLGLTAPKSREQREREKLMLGEWD